MPDRCHLGITLRIAVKKDAELRDRLWLRLCRKWPRRRRTTEKRDELAPLHARPLGSGRSILTPQTGILIGAETGIKTIAAVHSQCRLWVIRDRAIQYLWPVNVRYGPKADKLLRRGECPLWAKSDRRTAANSAYRKTASRRSLQYPIRYFDRATAIATSYPFCAVS